MNESSSPAPVIETRELVVSYGEQNGSAGGERRAVDGVSLSVEEGGVLGLLGPNGSGKSTLVSAVAGLRTPDAGEALVFGEAPAAAVRALLGVVFQESCLDRLMTVRETLSLHGRMFGEGGRSLGQRIEELLEQFGLAERAHDRVATLSGGMRRRLELARALLPGPRVLLLDEPTTGLDLDARRSFWAHLRAASDEGMTLLLATNDVLEAERECDTIAFLDRGRLIAHGTPAELKKGLKHDSVRLECTDGRAAVLSEAIAGWPGVGAITNADPVLHVTVDDASSFVPRLFEACSDGIRTIHIEGTTLEDAYFQLAGSPLTASEGAAAR